MKTKEKIGVIVGLIIFMSIFPIVYIATDTPWNEIVQTFKMLGTVALCVFVLFVIADLIAPLFGWHSFIVNLFDKPNGKRDVHKKS